MIIYKIRSKQSGLFSSGGTAPRFRKVGKIWKRRGDLILHLGQVKSSCYETEDVEVVEYVMREEETKAIPISEVLNTMHTARQEKMDKEYRQYKERLRKMRYKDYQALKKEFEE